MVKVLHWCALRISDCAIWLHEKGDNLELWCDERPYLRKWTIFGMAYDVPIAWLEVPKHDPAEFKIPMPGEYVAPTPRPITCANCGEGKDAVHENVAAWQCNDCGYWSCDL